MKLQHDLNQNNIQQWLVAKVSALVGMPSSQINVHAPLAEYGLDSVHAVGLSGDIEDWLSISIEPTVAWDFPTIEEMSKYLWNEIKNTVCCKESALSEQRVASNG